MIQPVRAQASAPSARPYRGGCQCGAVHYEVSLDLSQPPDPASSVWEYAVPSASFKLLIGDESLSGYQFFADGVHHFFCVRCGVRVFSHHMVEGAADANHDFYTHDSYTVDVRNLHSRRAPTSGWKHVGALLAARAH